MNTKQEETPDKEDALFEAAMLDQAPSAKRAHDILTETMATINQARHNLMEISERLMFMADEACGAYNAALDAERTAKNKTAKLKADCWETWKVYRDAKKEFEYAQEELNSFLSLFSADGPWNDLDKHPF